MFEVDSADKCAGKLPLMLMGGRAECLACADPGARNPSGLSGNLYMAFMDRVSIIHHCFVMHSLLDKDDHF